MYKIQQPSKQDQANFGLKKAQYQQQTHDDSLYDEITQIQTHLQREEQKQMNDFKSHFLNQEFSKNQLNNDLWQSIRQIEVRIQEQELHFQSVNLEQQEEIIKLKDELNQQKYLYETKIEEIKKSRILSSYQQDQSPYTSENNREYNYRSNNNYFDEQKEKHYLQQLVKDLKQQIQILQKKSFFVQNQNDMNREQKYSQQENYKDQIHTERIQNLETQIINQKLFYEKELSELKKQFEEIKQEDIKLKNVNQQLLQDVNSYKNKFNQVTQQLSLQSQQYQSQIYQIQLESQKNYSFENMNQNQQQLLELTEQLQALTILLEKKIQECEFYKQQLYQQQPFHQNQQIYTNRLSVTPTKYNIQTQNQNTFRTPNKLQIQKQQFQ